MNARPMPMWRSLLFVPANVERFIARAHLSGADAIELDLEDAVAPSEKAAARRAVAQAAVRVSQDGADVVVRINRPLSLAIDDISASVGPHVTALALPKVMGADHVRLLSEHVAECEMRAGLEVGQTRFIAMIETAEAIFFAREIAACDPRIVGVILGVEDFATDVGIDPESDAILPFHASVIAASAAAGVRPLGLIGSIAEFRDLAAFGATIARSKAFGYRGAACIHPAQVPVVNAAFTPAAADIEQARKIVAAYDAALESGAGAIQIDGKMIDIPIANRARALLASYESFPSPVQH